MTHNDILEIVRQAEQARKLISPSSLGLGTLSSALDTSKAVESMRELAQAQAEAREAPTARRAVQRILDEIRQFEASLSASQEVGMQLVSFGSSVVVHVTEVGFWQPNLVTFGGFLEDRSPVRLIQHLSQLSFLLRRVPRLEPDQPRRPIGFSAPSTDSSAA